jgi:hypothetical protein
VLAAGTAVCVAAPAAVLAQSSGAAVRFEVEAGAACPDRAAFIERVRARNNRFHESRDGEMASTYRVTLVAGDTATGSVVCTEPDGATTTRTLGGGSCSEVADALALVVALGIDADASAAGPVRAEAAAPAASTAASSRPSAFEESVRTPVRADDRPTPADRPRLGGPLTLSTGGGVSASSGAAPGPAFGPRVFVEVATAAARAPGWSAVADAELGLEGATTEASAGGQTARFAWITATLDVCPLHVTLGRFEASTCVGGEAGELDANASRQATRPWLAAAGRLALRWSPAGPLFVRIDAGAALAIVRDSFVFDAPPAAVYAVPAVGARGAAVVGARFW